jgi:hypothetical protein
MTTNQYILARFTGRDPNLRASDADRERVADRLRKSHAEGRLDMTEFQERLERCYDSKTFGELGELVRDLPREVEPERHRSFAWLRALPLVPLVPILLVLFALAAVTGHEHHVSWLWIPIVFLFVRMFWWRRRHSWSGHRRGHDNWL